MGLDMYLEAQRYYWGREKKPALEGVPEGYAVKSVFVEVAYWRKANAIHRWFVNNVQNGVDDCGKYQVENYQIIELRDLCKDVLAKKDPADALTRLPTMSGFFFGSTGYNEGYWQDVADTVEVLDKAISAFVPEPGVRAEWDFYYHSSW